MTQIPGDQQGYEQPGYDPYGSPGYGSPDPHQPGHGQPSLGRPSSWHPDYAQPGYGQPDHGQPDHGQPGLGQPGPYQPDYAQPGYGQPAYHQPNPGYLDYGQPAYGSPVPDQPGFGQPGYNQPGYNQPGYPPPLPAGYQPRPPGTDGFAIASFVLSLLGGVLLAVVMALVALSRIRRNRTGGRGLAIAALAISGVWVVVIGGLVAAMIATSPQRDDAGTVTRAGSQNVRTVQAGDCLQNFAIGDDAQVSSVQEVPCTQPHNAQVMGDFRLADGPYPGEDAIVTRAEADCPDTIPTDLGGVDPNQLTMMYLYPRPATWALADRTVSCIIVSENAPLTTKLGP